MIFVPIIKTTERGIETTEFYKNNFDTLVGIADVFTLSPTADDLRVVVKFSCAVANLTEWLLHSRRFHQRRTKEDCNFAFAVKSDYISLYLPGRTITVCAYETKFMQDFTDFQTAQELELCDDMRRPTCAQDAKSAFLSTICSNIPHAVNIFKLRYPEPTLHEYSLLLAAKNTCRAFFYAVPGEYVNAHSYDFKKSYASRLNSIWTPYGAGKPINAENELPARWWGIFQLRIHSIAAREYDFLKLIPEDGKPFTTVFTTETLYLLKKHYVVEYEFKTGYAYKMRRGAFTEFIDNRLQKQMYSKPAQRYFKAQINLLIGTFARKDRNEKIYYTRKGELKAKEEPSEFTNPYLPIYLFVVGHALRALLDIITPVWNHVLYANTDGFIIRRERRIIQPVLPGEIGYLEYRANYRRLTIRGVSDYAGEWIDADGVIRCDVKQSGVIHDDIDYKTYVSKNYAHYRLLRQSNGFTKFYIEEHEE